MSTETNTEQTDQATIPNNNLNSGLADIISKLDTSANWMYGIGTILFLAALWLSFAIFIDIKNTTLSHLNYLTSVNDSTKIDSIKNFAKPNEIDNDFSLSKLLSFQSGKTSVESVLPAKSNSDVTARVIYLVVRTTGLTAIVTAFFYFLFGISRAFFDQGSRTIKRRNGALYLKFLFDKYESTIRQEVTLPEIMNSFDLWNKTVESAFTQNPAPNKKSEDDKK